MRKVFVLFPIDRIVRTDSFPRPHWPRISGCSKKTCGQEHDSVWAGPTSPRIREAYPIKRIRDRTDLGADHVDHFAQNGLEGRARFSSKTRKISRE